MTILQLQYFLSLCQIGSTSQAAELLHVSQSTLSLSLKNMEQELQLSLFSRSNKGLTLTREGEVLKAHAERVLREFELMKLAMSELTQQHRNQITLGISTHVGVTVFPSLLEQARILIPNLEFKTLEGSGAELLELLKNRKLDAVISVVYHPEDIREPFTKVSIGTAPELVLCISAKNPLALKKNLRYDELLSMPLVYLRSAGMEHIKELYHMHGCKPDFRYPCDQISFAGDMIRRDLAAGFFNANIAAGFNNVRTIPIPELEKVDFYLIYIADGDLSPGVKMFLEFIQNFSLD